jgi:hypothetical protein
MCGEIVLGNILFLRSFLPQFQDGLSYSKNRMDEAIATGIFESVPKEKEVNKNKKEDVDLIVRNPSSLL